LVINFNFFQWHCHQVDASLYIFFSFNYIISSSVIYGAKKNKNIQAPEIYFTKSIE